MPLSVKESIEVEVGAGETIYDAIKEAKELSKNRNAGETEVGKESYQ